VPHNLIPAQYSPVPLPKFQMAPRLKILMSSGSKKGTQIYYPLLSESPGKRIPSWFPNGAPMEKYTHLQGIFKSLLIFLFVFPSESAVRKPTPCSLKAHSVFPNSIPMDRDAPSPEPLAYLFIHSFTYFCRSPQKGALLYMWKNIRSPSTEPRMDRPMHNGVWPGYPGGMPGGNHTHPTLQQNKILHFAIQRILCASHDSRNKWRLFP